MTDLVSLDALLLHEVEHHQRFGRRIRTDAARNQRVVRHERRHHAGVVHLFEDFRGLLGITFAQNKEGSGSRAGKRTYVRTDGCRSSVFSA